MLSGWDDRTTGLVIRALRRRRGWSQIALAARAGVSQSTVSRAERGWLEGLTLRVIRALYVSLEARLQLTPRWKGAELERLLDEEHSMVVAAVARRLEAIGWSTQLEVTYSEFGERGSIDILGLRSTDRAVVVIEVKTDVASSEAIGRKVDEKARLAPKIVAQRWGWSPVAVGRLVVMPDTMRLRRLVARHEVIGRMFPVDGIAIRRWLLRPARTMAGLWFISDTRPGTGGSRPSRPRRRIAAGASVERAPGPQDRGRLGPNATRRVTRR
jgi:transcriptional regulator with XRE-family HTH domain